MALFSNKSGKSFNKDDKTLQAVTNNLIPIIGSDRLLIYDVNSNSYLCKDSNKNDKNCCIDIQRNISTSQDETIVSEKKMNRCKSDIKSPIREMLPQILQSNGVTLIEIGNSPSITPSPVTPSPPPPSVTSSTSPPSVTSSRPSTVPSVKSSLTSEERIEARRKKAERRAQTKAARKEADRIKRETVRLKEKQFNACRSNGKQTYQSCFNKFYGSRTGGTRRRSTKKTRKSRK
jgi:hypothetical protein